MITEEEAAKLAAQEQLEEARENIQRLEEQSKETQTMLAKVINPLNISDGDSVCVPSMEQVRA